MIDRDHKLPLARQAKAVGISRGSITTGHGRWAKPVSG